VFITTFIEPTLLGLRAVAQDKSSATFKNLVSVSVGATA